MKGLTASDSLQKVHTEKKDCLFHLDFKPIDAYDGSFMKESHPLSLMVSVLLLCVCVTTLDIDTSSSCNGSLFVQVQHKRVELLRHPVVKSIIKYKWKKYGQIVYFLNLAFYAIFLIFLTSFALVVLNPSHPTCKFNCDHVCNSHYSCNH